MSPKLAAPPPIVGLDKTLTSRYRPDSKGTVVDPIRSAAYDAAIAPLRESRALFAKQANAYTRSHKPEDALTEGNWLESWAKAGALMHFSNHDVTPDAHANHSIQQFNLSLTLCAIAMSYAQVREALPQPQRAAIDAWLVKADATLETPKEPAHNHAYWQGAAHAAVGAAIHDAALFDKGYAMAQFGVRSIDADLLFPAEMKRGERALDYQFFAAMPLLLTAELGMRQGRDLYREAGGALPKLVEQRLLPALRDDPSVRQLVEQRAGQAQRPVKQTNLPAIALYNTRFPDPATVDTVNRTLQQRLDNPSAGESEEQTLMPWAAHAAPTIGHLFMPQLGGEIALLYPGREKAKPGAETPSQHIPCQSPRSWLDRMKTGILDLFR